MTLMTLSSYCNLFTMVLKLIIYVFPVVTLFDVLCIQSLIHQASFIILCTNKGNCCRTCNIKKQSGFVPVGTIFDVGDVHLLINSPSFIHLVCFCFSWYYIWCAVHLLINSPIFIHHLVLHIQCIEKISTWMGEVNSSSHLHHSVWLHLDHQLGEYICW
jgi:hypothetical protein